MIQIRITQFAGYTEELFLDFLRAHPLSFTNIIVPKYHGNMDGVEMQCFDYYRALYVGQLLGNLSEDIVHDVPERDSPGEFSFIIATTRWEELAACLVWIFKGFDPKEEDFDALYKFELAAIDLFNTLTDDESLHCPLFNDIIEDLLLGN